MGDRAFAWRAEQGFLDFWGEAESPDGEVWAEFYNAYGTDSGYIYGEGRLVGQDSESTASYLLVVPEPASLSMLALGSLWLHRRRRSA